MFSVDNFYDFFQSHYGRGKTDILFWKFRHHGSKNFHDLSAIIANKSYATKFGSLVSGKSLILHDQEPFSVDALNTYRSNMVNEKKKECVPDNLLITNAAPSCSPHIFCHSELNSPDVSWLDKNGTIGCYYFWHALIARDWFRHWKHWKEMGGYFYSEGVTHRFLLYARGKDGTRAYRNNIIHDLSHMRNSILYDWDGVVNPDSDYSAKIDPQDAILSGIHLVAETLFDTQKIHLTEKVFKPIVMKQPFLLFAGPGSLAILKKYGFKTFSHLWDESYDHETDSSIRYKMLMDIISKLNSLSRFEFVNLIEKANDVVNYNQQYFFSDDFEKILLDEFFTNVQNAIIEQQHRIKDNPSIGYFELCKVLHENNMLTNTDLVHFRMVAQGMRMKDPLRFEKIKSQQDWISKYI